MSCRLMSRWFYTGWFRKRLITLPDMPQPTRLRFISTAVLGVLILRYAITDVVLTRLRLASDTWASRSWATVSSPLVRRWKPTVKRAKERSLRSPGSSQRLKNEIIDLVNYVANSF